MAGLFDEAPEKKPEVPKQEPKPKSRRKATLSKILIGSK